MQFRTFCYLGIVFFLGCHGKPPVIHHLERGQTLYQLAHVYGVTVEELMKSNAIRDPSSIPEGQKILIPGAGLRRKVPKSIFEVKAVNEELEKPSPAVSISPKEVKSKPGITKPKMANAPSSGKLRFLWPAEGTVISKYGVRNEKMHNGIDIRVSKGNLVRASATGQVAYVGNDIEGYGNLVILRHGKKTFSIYAYLGDIKVKKDDQVQVGQTIAEVVGNKGGFFHFEIRRAKQALDPERLLGGQTLDE